MLLLKVQRCEHLAQGSQAAASARLEVKPAINGENENKEMTELRWVEDDLLHWNPGVTP